MRRGVVPPLIRAISSSADRLTPGLAEGIFAAVIAGIAVLAITVDIRRARG